MKTKAWIDLNDRKPEAMKVVLGLYDRKIDDGRCSQLLDEVCVNDCETHHITRLKQ